MFVFMQYHLSLVTVALQYVLKSEVLALSALFFFFKIFFGYSGFLRFHMFLGQVFLFLQKKCHQDFDRDCTESIDYFG